MTDNSLAETKLLTRSAILVRDVGIRLRNEITILDHEVSGTSEHRHGGSKNDRQ